MEFLKFKIRLKKKNNENSVRGLKFYFENPGEIDYQVIEQEVFKSGKCLGCHSRNSPHSDNDAIFFGADMTEYESLGFLNGIVPGFLITQKTKDGKKVLQYGSKIYESVAVYKDVSHVDEGHFPLDSSKIELLRLWILNCAPETIHDEKNDELFEPDNPDGKERVCL